MSKTLNLLKGRLSAANAQLDRIRNSIKDLNLELTKAEDDLVTYRKDVEDIKAAIEAIPKRSN